MSRLWYHIKEGFRGVFRHLAMSLSSASAVTLTLILVGVFLVLNASLQYVTKNIQESVKLVAKISADYDTADLIPSIESQLQAIPGVVSVEYSSKDQQLDVLISKFPDGDGNAFETYKGEKNPLEAGIIVSTASGTGDDFRSDHGH